VVCAPTAVSIGVGCGWLLRTLFGLEHDFLSELRAWQRHDAGPHHRSYGQRHFDATQPPDRFDRRNADASQGRVRRAQLAKTLTNRVVAQATAAAAAAFASSPPAPLAVVHGSTAPDLALALSGMALVLDGRQACTTRALIAEGFPAARILAPNVVPEVAQHLRYVS
jgi:hypothetical protein